MARRYGDGRVRGIYTDQWKNKKSFRADGSPLWRRPRKGNLNRSVENKKPFRADGSPLWRGPRKGNLYRSMGNKKPFPGGWLAAMERAV
jgi:hypothetical protein